MSPQQIVAVLSRLLAVWLANHLPGQAYQIVFASNPSVDWSMTVFAVIGFVVELSVSLALWFFPLVVARNLLRSEERPPPASSDVWLAMGCAVIGLWLLCTSLPALVIDAFVPGSTLNVSGEISSSLRQNISYCVAEVALSTWLILGATGFRKVFWWARTAGISKSVD